MHGTVFLNWKQYNNLESTAPDALVRKTSTGHPVEDCQHCPFQVFIELREDSLWYLCQGCHHSNKADICCTHMFHLKLDPDKICNLSVHYAITEQKHESSTSASARAIRAKNSERATGGGIWHVPRPEKKSKVTKSNEKEVISCSSNECDIDCNNYLFKFTKQNPKQKLQELMDKLDDLPEKVKAKSYNCVKFDAANEIYWKDIDEYN